MPFAKPFAALGALLLAGSAALAQTYPVKPIRLIVPQGPGGGSDLVARLLSPEIEKRLGQPFVVENKPGGNDSIAPDAVATENSAMSIWPPSKSWIAGASPL